MMESDAGTIPFQGMTLRDILEKVDLINIQVEEGKEMKQKNNEKNEDGKTVIQVCDPTAAYLGPRLWDNQTISLNLDDDSSEINDVMNMEEFLAENNINLSSTGMESKPRDQEPMEISSPLRMWQELETPDSPDSLVDSKPVIRPSCIVRREKEEVKPRGNVLPKGENIFLYTESKRARLEREKEERRKKLEAELDFAPEDLALATVPGMDFNPKERVFELDELRPQPIIKKRKKTYVAEESKDDKYWENRFKNNVAARRSREARRLKENQIALRAAFLEKENRNLKKRFDEVTFDNTKLVTERDILKMKLARMEAAAAARNNN